MDILQMLQQKREVSKLRRHPLSSLSLNEKYSYLFGLGTMAQGNIKTIRELEQPFTKVRELLGVSESLSQEIIVDINNHFDKCFDGMIHMLCIEKRIAYCFIIDLLKIKQYAQWGVDYCNEIVKQYCYILKINQNILHFFDCFLAAAGTGNSEQAHMLANELKAQNMEMDYDLLCYMNPEYYESNHYDELVLNQGGTFRIENDTVVDGSIYVENGTMLYISNADLKIKGSIVIHQGRVIIEDSYIISTAEKGQVSYLLSGEEVHELKIERSQLDCVGNCAAISQSTGNLLLSDTKINGCEGPCGIYFSGNFIWMKECQVSHCTKGGMRIEGKARADLLNCVFEDCRAEHGAAMYISAIHEVHIRECQFLHCKARYLGGAVYFQYKRYGQQVLGCHMEECAPKDNTVFNAYEVIA